MGRVRTAQRRADNLLERAIMVFSIDTERMWGYFDLLQERNFVARNPQAVSVHDRLLETLVEADVRATWTVVGGLALRRCEGHADRRFDPLPRSWTAGIPAGDDSTRPLWYDAGFVERLRDATPRQDIGMHGGLTHLIWTHRECTAAVARHELEGGMRAHFDLGIQPVSFVYPRDMIAHREVLAQSGIRCYRGRAPVPSEDLRLHSFSPVLRVLEELGRYTPAPVWPEEVLPGLWNIPASSSLYPMARERARFVPLRTRLERFRRGVEAAVRSRRIFHLCFHPENLADSPAGIPLFGRLLNELSRWRDSGDIEVCTMRDVAERWDAWCERPPVGGLALARAEVSG